MLIDLCFFFFFHVNSQPKFISGMVELTKQLLEIMFGVSGQSCIISKQYFSDKNCMHLGLCSQVGQVE